MSGPLVTMTGIEKRFPGVHALDGARFELLPGEVHALLGENGAGKSTIMKVLAGIYRPDAGEILVKGAPVAFSGPRDALAAGISMVHQELNLVPHLTVAQNIFVGREARRGLGVFVDDRTINRAADELFERLNIALDPRAVAATLTVARQQMVEIAKALSLESDVLIMDEPTAALTDTEVAELFRIIRSLKASGVGVVHISHRLEELKQISDRITVMRDGVTVETLRTPDASLEEVIRLMVGRTVFGAEPELPERPDPEVLLEARNLCRGRSVQDVSLALHRGEILGVAGLVGAGRTEMARLIFGADRRDGGELYVRGQQVEFATPAEAVAGGVAYLSEDRKRYGLALGMSVEHNIVTASLSKFANALGWIQGNRTRTVAQQQVSALKIKTPGIGQKARNLSGGNQQKVVLAKWLTADSDVLIVDEPTRGIDVGAKSEIYALLNDLARQGKGIIMISSELPEILRMSHRILVMCEGRVTGELTAQEATQEKIMTYATMRASVVEVEHAGAGAGPSGATEGASS